MALDFIERQLKYIAEKGYNISIPHIRQKTWAKDFINKVLNSDKQYFMAILPRQSNKDITALQICAKYMAMSEKKTIKYIAHGKNAVDRIFYNNFVSHKGKSWAYWQILGFVKAIRSKSMFVSINGSVLEASGCDLSGRTTSTAVGNNYDVVVFTEFGLQNDTTFRYLLPTFSQREDGRVTKVIFISTPRGMNHMYHLYMAAQHKDHWYTLKMNCFDFPEGEYSLDRAYAEKDILSEGEWLSEYMCEFINEKDASLIYISPIVAASRDGRIQPEYGLEKGHPVDIVADIGFTSNTCMLFFARPTLKRDDVAESIYIIDMIEDNAKGYAQFFEEIAEKGYRIRNIILPHDAHHTVMSAVPRSAYQQVMELVANPAYNMQDAQVMVLKVGRKWDEIQDTRNNFHRLRISSKNCMPLIQACQVYKKVYNPATKSYSNDPCPKQECRHRMDALRYLIKANLVFLDYDYKNIVDDNDQYAEYYDC